MFERNAVAHKSCITAVDFRNLYEREILFAFLRRTDNTFYHIPCLQTEQLDLRLRHIDIIGRRKVVVIRRTQESISILHDFQHTYAAEDIVKLISLFTLGSSAFLLNGRIITAIVRRIIVIVIVIVVVIVVACHRRTLLVLAVIPLEIGVVVIVAAVVVIIIVIIVVIVADSVVVIVVARTHNARTRLMSRLLRLRSNAVIGIYRFHLGSFKLTKKF